MQLYPARTRELRSSSIASGLIAREGNRFRASHYPPTRSGCLHLYHDQSESNAESHCLGAIGSAKFHEERADVKFDRVVRDAQFRCDLFVAKPVGYHAQDFNFSAE